MTFFIYLIRFYNVQIYVYNKKYVLLYKDKQVKYACTIKEINFPRITPPLAVGALIDI